MSRFLSRKGSKDATAADESLSYDTATTAKHPRTLQKRLWRKKKGPSEHEAEVDFVPALPSPDKFRTSLIMPDLSARFSMLKGLNDSTNTKPFSNDSVRTETKDSSLLGDLPELGPILLDIAEAPSPRPSQDLSRNDSYSYSYGQSSSDSPASGSIMNRPRPVEGNVLFGSRQRAYKSPHANSSPFRARANLGGDVSMSAFQILREKEREVDREWRLAKYNRDQEAQDQEDDDDAELYSPSSKREYRGTTSSTTSGPSRVSLVTAATSTTGQPSPSFLTSPPQFASRSPPTKVRDATLVSAMSDAREQFDQRWSVEERPQESEVENKQQNIEALARLLRSEDNNMAATMSPLIKPNQGNEQRYLQPQQSFSEAQDLSQQERRQQRAMCVRTLTNAARNGRRAPAAVAASTPAPSLAAISAPVRAPSPAPPMTELHPALRPAPSFDMPSPVPRNFNIPLLNTERDDAYLAPLRAADLGGLIRGHLRHASDQSSVYPNSPRPFCPSTSEFNLLSPRLLSPSLSPSQRFSSLDSPTPSPIVAEASMTGLCIVQAINEPRLAAVPEAVRESCASDMNWQTAVPGRARAGTTETQYEREAFVAELAQRQKTVQASLRAKMENNRTPSPNVGTWSGFDRPFGLLRGKSSRDTITSKYESTLKPKSSAQRLSTKTSASSFVPTTKSSQVDTRRFGLDGACSPIGESLQTKLRGLNEDDTSPSSPEMLEDGSLESQNMNRSGSEKSSASKASQSLSAVAVTMGETQVARPQLKLEPLVTSFPMTPHQESFDASLQMQSPTGSIPTLSSTTSRSLSSDYASPFLVAPSNPLIFSSTSQMNPSTVSEARLHRKIHIQKGDISDPILITKTYMFKTISLPEGASLRNGHNGGKDMVLAGRRRVSLTKVPMTVRLVGEPSGRVVAVE